MHEAIGQSLLFAVAIAVFPIPIITSVLLLLAPRGRLLAGAFAAAWVLGLGLLGAVVLSLVSAGERGSSGTPTWVSWGRLVLGAALVVLAAYKAWGQVRRTGPPATPAWMRALETATPARAAGTGLVLSALNPKNIAFALAAAAAIVDLHLPAPQLVVVWAVFTVVASLGVLGPLAAAVAFGQRATGPLGSFRSWLQRNNGAIMGGLFLLLGVKILGDGIAGL